jgi:hypothetical protein
MLLLLFVVDVLVHVVVLKCNQSSIDARNGMEHETLRNRSLARPTGVC